MGSQTRLHAELIGLLRQHSRFAAHRHLLLAWMVAGLLLSQSIRSKHRTAAAKGARMPCSLV